MSGKLLLFDQNPSVEFFRHMSDAEPSHRLWGQVSQFASALARALVLEKLSCWWQTRTSPHCVPWNRDSAQGRHIFLFLFLV